MVAAIFSARQFENKSDESVSRFLRLNRLYWSAYGQPPGAGTIAVDLVEGYISIAHLNLLVAKYVQRTGGGDLVGIVSSAEMSPDHLDRLKAIAESFGVAQFFDLASEHSEDEGYKLNAYRELRALLGRGDKSDAARQLIALRHPHHAFVGSSIYAGLLRWRKGEELDLASPEMCGAAAHMMMLMERLRRHFEGVPLVAYVTAHTHYPIYSAMAASTIGVGGEVFFLHPGKNVFVSRFADVMSLFRCRPPDFAAWFANEFVPNLAAHPDFIAFEQHLLERVRGARHDVDLAPAPILLNQRDGHSIMIFAHALTDNVHGWGTYIYRDFGEWLWRTLEIATRAPHVRFFVKPHPSDSHYDAGGLLSRLQKHFAAASNIIFLDEGHPGIDPRSLTAGVTVQGAPGVEMAACGLRMVCLSAGRFGDLGFAAVPQSVEEYELWLTQPQRLAPMSAAEVLNARGLAFYESVAGRGRTFFSPGLRHEDDPDYFDRCSDALLEHAIGEDPLYRAILAMRQSGRGFLLNEGWWQSVLQSGGPGWPLERKTTPDDSHNKSG